MHKLILVLGISGSGKTYWSRQWAEEDPEHRVRLNYDDIRCMFGKYWVPGNREQLMKDMFSYTLSQAMYSGYDIVIDNMSNLNPKHQKEYTKLVENHNSFVDNPKYIIEYHFMDTSVEECIRRDSLRPIPIGEKVIKEQWHKYRTYIISNIIKDNLNKQLVQDDNLPHCIIVDMDATLCWNVTERPFFGVEADERVIEDIPNTPVVKLVRNYCEITKCSLIIITGRSESCREATLEWLDNNWLYPTLLLMRPNGNYISGPEMKKFLYEENIKNKYYVDFIVEDSSKVVEMYRNLGLTVLQPNDGKF